MAPWTKASAIERATSDPILQRALQLAPALRPLIDAAIKQDNQRGYNRFLTMLKLCNEAAKWVGWEALDPALSLNLKAFDAVMRAIEDILPPDDIDIARRWKS